MEKEGFFGRHVWPYWRSIIAVGLPIALIPFLTSSWHEPATRCGYVVVIMAAYWMTEAVPLAITALIPVVLFPLLGVLSTDALCEVYLKETNMMFIGGLMVAIAVEHCNLHKRIALLVLLRVGSSQRWLMLGFMMTTMFLSMWISNTATTAMMVPIVEAVLYELYKPRPTAYVMSLLNSKGDAEAPPSRKNSSRRRSSMALVDPRNLTPAEAAVDPIDTLNRRKSSAISAHHPESTDLMRIEFDDDTTSVYGGDYQFARLNILMSVAYASNIGGTGFLTGTGPNLIVKWNLDKKDGEGGEEMATGYHSARKSILMACAYSANVGGTGTLTGTSPNLVVKAELEKNYGNESGLNFGTWMLFNVPGMLINVTIAWIWLQVMFLEDWKAILPWTKKETRVEAEERKRLENESSEAAKKVIKEKYEELGRMTFHELATLVLFITLIMLWLFRSPQFIKGWADFFTQDFFPPQNLTTIVNGQEKVSSWKLKIDDATPAMLIVMLFFLIPAKPNFWLWRDDSDPERPVISPALLEWKVVHEKLPWGVMLLLGGGFAMAEASEKSGLNEWLGTLLAHLDGIPPVALVFIVTIMTAMITEVASNTATATILMPVLNDLAKKIKVHPLYLMLPAAVSCSYAFMLPVATPPNAIVFSAAGMQSTDMIKPGFFMNVICVVVINVMINTLGKAIWDLDTFPDWAIDPV